jgi:hypothetical protein
MAVATAGAIVRGTWAGGGITGGGNTDLDLDGLELELAADVGEEVESAGVRGGGSVDAEGEWVAGEMRVGVGHLAIEGKGEVGV